MPLRPRIIHLLNGLYDAKLDNTPVIAICGRGRSRVRRPRRGDTAQSRDSAARGARGKGTQPPSFAVCSSASGCSRWFAASAASSRRPRPRSSSRPLSSRIRGRRPCTSFATAATSSARCSSAVGSARERSGADDAGLAYGARSRFWVEPNDARVRARERRDAARRGPGAVTWRRLRSWRAEGPSSCATNRSSASPSRPRRRSRATSGSTRRSSPAASAVLTTRLGGPLPSRAHARATRRRGSVRRFLFFPRAGLRVLTAVSQGLLRPFLGSVQVRLGLHLRARPTRKVVPPCCTR